VRHVINGVCYQRYEKRLEQQKCRPDVNVRAAEENLEEKLELNQYSIIVSIQTSTLTCFGLKQKLSGFLLCEHGFFWCAIWVYLKSLHHAVCMGTLHRLHVAAERRQANADRRSAATCNLADNADNAARQRLLIAISHVQIYAV